MKKTTVNLVTAAVSAVALSAGAAAAQTWTSINDRQANLDMRIEDGVRSGDLTATEARELREAFEDIADLEADYRADGLSDWERDDLQSRFDALSSRIRYDRADYQDRWDDWRGPDGGWMNINARQDRLDDRIDEGVRSGRLTAREARSLRTEFRDIARLESRYRLDGLSGWERDELDRRFDALSARLRWERRDGEDYAYRR